MTSQADFDKSYRAYIELARDLAKQAGIPLTLDTSDIAGIKTHNYASRTGHGSDHVDPIAFLAKGGVSYEQLKRDIENGFDAQIATKKETENNFTEEIEMYLIECTDTKRCYISNGVDVRYVKTIRMLGNYKNQFGKLNLRVDKMYQSELDAEFGKNATDPKRDISK